MLVTPRVFKFFHIYIMQKTLNFVQTPIIYEMYVNLSLCMMKLKRNKKKISFLLIHSLIDFRDQFIKILHTQSTECTTQFNSIVNMLLSQDIHRITRKITHVQRLLIHISKKTNRTQQTLSLQKKCTYILRDSIILDSETKQHMFHQTKSIVSKLPCSAHFQYQHIIYNAVYKNIIMCHNSDSDMVHSESLTPLLFCITNCMKKQNCCNGRQMQKLIMKTTGFISCSLYLWGNDDSIYKQHSILWLLTMTFYNIVLNTLSQEIQIQPNFLNILKSITQCVSQADSLSLWTINKLKIIFKIFCIYTQQKQFSHGDVVGIQRFICNNQLQFIKPISLEFKFIQLLYDFSFNWTLQLIKYNEVHKQLTTPISRRNFYLIYCFADNFKSNPSILSKTLHPVHGFCYATIYCNTGKCPFQIMHFPVTTDSNHCVVQYMSNSMFFPFQDGAYRQLWQHIPHICHRWSNYKANADSHQRVRYHYWRRFYWNCVSNVHLANRHWSKTKCHMVILCLFDFVKRIISGRICKFLFFRHRLLEYNGNRHYKISIVVEIISNTACL